VTSSEPSLASVLFKCDDLEPERPQRIAAAAQHALVRKLSRDGIQLNNFLEPKADSQAAMSGRVTGKAVKEHRDISSQALPRRSTSETFSCKGHFHWNFPRTPDFPSTRQEFPLSRKGWPKTILTNQWSPTFQTLPS
jgi:hypothetical protein